MRSTVWNSVSLFAIALALLGCEAAATVDDAGSSRDAGARIDAGDEEDVDAGIDEEDVDAGIDEEDVDAGLVDGGAGDAGLPDAGVADAGEPHPTDLRILLLGNLRSGAGAGFPSTMFPALLDDWGTVTAVPDVMLSAVELAKYDLIVFANTADALSTGEHANIAIWVKTQGGRALVLAGYAADERPEVNSITSAFDLPVDLTRPDILSGATEFSDVALTDAGLAAPPAFSGGFAFAPGATPAEVADEAVIGTNVVARRFTASTGDGRAFVWLDEVATLDPNWNVDTATFWSNVLGFLFP